MKKRVFAGSILIFLIAMITFWLYAIPAIFSNEKFVNNLLSSQKIKVEKPEIKTYLAPKLSLKVQKIEIPNALDIKNLDTDISFTTKKLIVNRLLDEYLFADVNSLMNMFPQNETFLFIRMHATSWCSTETTRSQLPSRKRRGARSLCSAERASATAAYG